MVAVAGYALRIVRLAQVVGEEAGNRGAWRFGFHGDELSGSVSHTAASNRHSFFGGDADPYETDTHTDVTTAHASEVDGAPKAIQERLAGRLLQGLGSYSVLSGFLRAKPV